MKRAALAALLIVACSRKQTPPAPVAVDAAPPEPSMVYVARTEPPSIWQVSASGKIERLHISVDPEIIERPQGSSLPRVTPDGKKIVFVRGMSLVMRHIASGLETELKLNRKPVIVAIGPESRRVIYFGDKYAVGEGSMQTLEPPGDIIAWLPDDSMLLDEAPRAQLSAKRLLRWRIGQEAQPIPLSEGEYGQFDVGRNGKRVVAAAASGKQSRIVRFDLDHPVVEAVTTAGDYHWPKLSPNEEQVAFERGGEVWLRDHMVIQPSDQLVDYAWVDDRTLIVETASQLTVVSTDRVVRSVVPRERGE